MKAKSIKATNLETLPTAFRESLQDGFTPTLAIVFASIKQDLDAIGHFFKSQDIQVFGATTHGEFVDAEVNEGTIAALLLDLSPQYFEIYFESLSGGAYRESAQKIAQKALSRFERPAFLIAGSNLATDAEALLHGFEDVVGKEVTVMGTMAGDDFTFNEQFVFSNTEKSNHGLACIALNEDKVQIAGFALCGWKPLGTEKTITRSEGNHVYAIDGEPALDVIAKYAGITDVSPQNMALAEEIGAYCALQLQREDGPPVMRPGLNFDFDDHSFYCSGKVPQGSKVRFSLPPDFDAIEEVVQGVAELKEHTMPEADALIYFNCGGRLVTFGPLISKEIEGIQEIWGVPMAGMFSNAELGRAKGGGLEAHTLSSCCVVLKEL